MVTVSHFPCATGSFATMDCDSVSWYFPPNGMKTLPAPMEPSNISTRPFWEQTFKSASSASHAAFISFFATASATFGVEILFK